MEISNDSVSFELKCEQRLLKNTDGSALYSEGINCYVVD